MPYRLDLAALRPHELRRALPPGTLLVARPALAAARLAHRSVLAPDHYPETLELRDTREEDWEELGASAGHAQAARSMRDALGELGAEQVGAFRLADMPYPRNLLAYTKTPDVFAALYLADADGPSPYLEFITVFRAPREGLVALVTSSSSTADPLDPSARIAWQSLPGAGVDTLFQAHRGRLNTLGKANRKAVSAEDFREAFLAVWNENYAAWRGRGVLLPAGGA